MVIHTKRVKQENKLSFKQIPNHTKVTYAVKSGDTMKSDADKDTNNTKRVKYITNDT